MDSKSVRRVCESLGAPARYNSAQKLWTIEGKSKVHEISSADIATMPSRTLRALLLDQPTGTPQVPANVSKDDIANAQKILGIKKSSTEKKAAKAAKRSAKKSELSTFAIDCATPRKPGRKMKADEGKLWLTAFGIHKWALRQKAKKHGAPSDVQKLLAKPTKWYAKAEMRDIVKVVFDDQDKLILKQRDDVSPRLVKIAETSRKIAETIIGQL